MVDLHAAELPEQTIPSNRMRLIFPGSLPSKRVVRALLLINGAGLVIGSPSNILWISLGDDYAFPIALGTNEPGLTAQILLYEHAHRTLNISEFTLSQPLAFGAVHLHVVEAKDHV